MIVYSSDKMGFRNDVRDNLIELKIHDAFQKTLGHRTSQQEIASWKNSLMYMSNVLDDEVVPDRALIAIEFVLPRSSKRVDFIVSGLDDSLDHSVVIIELKQWSSAERTDQPGVVRTYVGGGLREVTHPSYQAWSYSCYLKDFSDVVESEGVKIWPCAYLHNCESSIDLRDEIYEEDIKNAPLFLRPDVSDLTKYISEKVVNPPEVDIVRRIDNGGIRPSKKLAEALGSMLHGNQEFVMLDDQKIVFEKAMKLASSSSATDKNVLIVNGGPGTGKSVVAVNLLVRMLSQRMNSQYVSKNAAPREVYSAKLTGQISNSRYRSLFVGSGGFYNMGRNSLDALIVDEAHRLNEKSGLYSNLGENQVKEIIQCSNFSVFFLDENQRIAFNDIGSASEIEHWALKEGAIVTTLELSSQFRCNGSEGYLAWLENHLQIRETANLNLSDVDYDFRVFDTADEMHAAISRHQDRKESARTVAGYCWDWLSQKDPSAFDIEIGQLKMRWNLKSYGNRWIMHPDSINEAGCIHTCQGLELDYVGVIVGPDFIVRDGFVVTDGYARPGRDKTIRGFRGLYKRDSERAIKLADEIIKNTYRTLMTRGMKGCYVYCTDSETNDYFKGLINRSN